jgi:hypothetical protein
VSVVWHYFSKDAAGAASTVTVNHNFNFASLEELSKAIRIRDDAPKPHAVIQVDSSTHAHTSSEPVMGDSLTATGALFPLGMHNGLVIVSAGKLAEESALEVAFRVFNGTGKVLRVLYIEGAIRGGKGDLRDMPELPRPTWKAEFTSQPVEPYCEFMVVINQQISPRMASEFLEIMVESYVTLDLRSLNIVAEVADSPGNRSRIPLWDAVTIRRKDDVFTGRVHIASASLAASASVSASASLSRAERSNGE